MYTVASLPSTLSTLPPRHQALKPDKNSPTPSQNEKSSSNAAAEEAGLSTEEAWQLLLSRLEEEASYLESGVEEGTGECWCPACLAPHRPHYTAALAAGAGDVRRGVLAGQAANSARSCCIM